MNHVSSESVNVASQPQHKKFLEKKENNPLSPKPNLQKKELKCWFWKSARHKKSNCLAFKSFLETKGKGVQEQEKAK